MENVGIPLEFACQEILEKAVIFATENFWK